MNNSNTNENNPKNLEISKMKEARRAAAAIFIGATGGALAVNALSSETPTKESNLITTEAPAPTTTEAPVTSTTSAGVVVEVPPMPETPVTGPNGETGSVASGQVLLNTDGTTVIQPPMPETPVTGPNGETGSVASGQIIEQTPPTTPGN